jgi:uncharacterized protein
VKLSQFVVFSDSALCDVDGNVVRVLFQSATSQVYLLPQEVVDRFAGDAGDLSSDERAELAQARILVDEGEDEFGAVVAENIAAAGRTDVRTFVLMPTAYCNMGCEYCGQQHFKSPQSPRHRQAVVDRVLRAVHDSGTTSLHINWFGAEPLMGYAQIRDISAAVIPACDDRELPFSARLVTNGSLLTLAKLRTLHHDCRVGHFEITLDGLSHNALRPLKSGRGSLARTVDLIAEAVADAELSELTFSVRSNISQRNRDEHAGFAALVRQAGLATDQVGFYATPVRSWGNDVSDVAIPAGDIATVERQWLDAYLANGLTTAVLPTGRKPTVCVAVARGAEVVDPTGNLHSCTEQPLVPGRETTALGHITDLGMPALRPAGAYDTWNQELRDRTTPATCPSCSIFPICGGHCPLVWGEGWPACPTIKTTLPMRLTRYGETLGLTAA